MKEYHYLENEILNIFRLINDNENNKDIEKLLNIFQKYWKSYQDNWSSRYWDIYNIIYEENFKYSDSEKNNNKDTNESSKYNIKDNQFKNNNLDNESLISIEDFKNGIELNNKNINNYKENNNKNQFIINNESLLKNYCQQKIKRKKDNNNINKINDLDKIDKELDNLDNLMEKSFIEINNKNEKNRSCLDCIIF
jgi:hypothetical protein